MRSLPLKYKLVLAPAVIIIPVIFVIFLMLYYLNIIGQQNDTVRNWAHTTDQIRIAITSSKQLKTIVNKLPHTQSTENEELIFNYIEQSRVLEGSITNSILRGKVQEETLDELQIISKKIKFKEKMDTLSVSSNLTVLIPKLEQLYNSLQAQKRAIYIDSNEYVKNKTSTLASISVSVLVLCVLLGIILSLWISRSTISKIKQLAQNANFVCDLSPQASHKSKKFDELEDIALCLSIISNRMLNTIAAEKLLQSVEDERSRIAMDIHDQFLSDLNIFKRTLNQKFISTNTSPICDIDINEINSTLDELTFTLRGIIDDLHPQALDMFGLEAALQSYLDRKLSSENHPDYYINIDRMVENKLSLFQKLSLYRILLESIQNIIRHAHCSRYEIDLRVADDFLVLTIDDNGIGINMDEHTQKRGHGIFNITQRAYSIKAEIQWNTSRFSTGTQVLLKLPIQFVHSQEISSIDIKASPYVQTI
ncbi:MAG: hypothetical protein KAJ39_05495 [Gammaproteobacteria bacterium]|nr:hypothetical protein [Gammaproteobacteria bacterium]